MLKLIISALLPLSADESYYWVWSHHLQLSYYDHPPLIAWLLWLGHALEPLGHSVRWPGVIVGHSIFLIWILIWRNVSRSPREEAQFHWWFWLALCSPLLGFGSIILTPDLPVLFFWSCALLFSISALKQKNFYHYAGLGVSLGLGFCSKYHIVLFVPLLLTYLTVERKWKSVSLKGSLGTVFFGILFSAPVLIWNFQNDFISFQFQLNHGLGRLDYTPFWTWSYLLAQIIVLFPTVAWAGRRAHLQGPSRIFLYFGWGPLIFFFLSSFKGLVEINWPIVAYPAFFAMAVLGYERTRLFKYANWFWVILFSLLCSHLVKPWIPSAPEKLSELSQFRPIISKIDQYQPLYANTYQMASWLWYETKKPVYKLNQMSRYDMFDTFPQGRPQVFPIYLAMKTYDEIPAWISRDPLRRMTTVEKMADQFIIVRIE